MIAATFILVLLLVAVGLLRAIVVARSNRRIAKAFDDYQKKMAALDEREKGEQMIAAFTDGKELHIIKWTGRVKLHAGVICYCSAEGNAAEGVLQVPDAVFDRGVPFTISVNAGAAQKLVPCGRCRMAVQAAIS